MSCNPAKCEYCVFSLRRTAELDLRIRGGAHVLFMERLHDGATVMEIDGDRHVFSVRALGDGRHDVTLGHDRALITVYTRGEQTVVFAPLGTGTITEIDPIAHAGDHAGEEGRLTAPMPGKLIALPVKKGEAVSKGQVLAVMEAMKMEHTITAPRDGVVDELLHAVGDQVAEGGELLRLKSE